MCCLKLIYLYHYIVNRTFSYNSKATSLTTMHAFYLCNDGFSASPISQWVNIPRSVYYKQ